jgi:arylsulfatase A-like enzyme
MYNRKSTRTFVVALSTMLMLAGCVKPVEAPAPSQPIASSTESSAPATPLRPNVVWILLDACRAENLSCYGYDRPTTPNIDKIAARGVVFEQAYSQSNWTARSVPSYMTGKYFAVSCLDLGGRVELMRVPPANEVLLPEIMGRNGYHTAMFSAHLAFIRPGCRLWRSFDEAEMVRFDEVKGVKVKPNFEDIHKQVLPWLETKRDRPFFLYIHAVDTHFPHILKPPDNQWVDPAYDPSQLGDDGTGQVYKRKDKQPYTDADKAYFRGLYDGSLHYADRQVGVLVDSMEKQGLLENTIIIIGADHGEALGEDGDTFEHTHGGSSDAVFRVPLIFAGPGIPVGVRVSKMVENADIVPSLIDLLQLKTRAKTDGKSLMPIARDPNGPAPHECVFAYRIGQSFPHPPPYDDDPAIFLRSESLKYDYDPTLSAEFLWRVPDNLAARQNVLAQEQSAKEALRMKWENDLKPLRQAYLDLPATQIVIEGFNIKRKAMQDDAFVEWGDEENAVQQTDNKWTMQDRYIWCGPDEIPPTIQMSVSVPVGTFHVAITALSSQDLFGKPASSLTVAVESAPPTTITVAALPSDQAAFEATSLGNILVKDGSMDFTIGKGAAGFWTSICKIVITPVTLDKTLGKILPDFNLETLEEQRKRNNALDDLGYNGKTNSSLQDNKDQEEALKSQGYL